MLINTRNEGRQSYNENSKQSVHYLRRDYSGDRGKFFYYDSKDFLVYIAFNEVELECMKSFIELFSKAMPEAAKVVATIGSSTIWNLVLQLINLVG